MSFFRRAAASFRWHRNPLETFFDGDEALDYLARLTETGGTLPIVLFTDVKPLGRDGFEVISRTREQPALHAMSIYVLTGSEYPKYRARATEQGVDGYLLKFPTKEKFAEIVANASAKPSQSKG